MKFFQHLIDLRSIWFDAKTDLDINKTLKMFDFFQQNLTLILEQ